MFKLLIENGSRLKKQRWGETHVTIFITVICFYWKFNLSFPRKRDWNRKCGTLVVNSSQWSFIRFWGIIKRLNMYLCEDIRIYWLFYCENYHQFSLIYGAVGVGVYFWIKKFSSTLASHADGSSLARSQRCGQFTEIFFANSWVQFEATKYKKNSNKML